MEQQTSVEWLCDKLLNAPPCILEWDKYLKQAKEIHKKEVIETYKEGYFDRILNERTSHSRAGEYYNEKYKTK